MLANLSVAAMNLIILQGQWDLRTMWWQYEYYREGCSRNLVSSFRVVTRRHD